MLFYPTTIFPSENPEINGFFRHNIGKIPHIVTATNSCYNSPEIVFDFTKLKHEDYWHGCGLRNSISVEFPVHKLQLAYYSLQTFDFDEGHTHPKSWEMYGTKVDGTEVLIDTVENSGFTSNLEILTRSIYSNAYFTSFKYIITSIHDPILRKFTIFKIDFYGRLQHRHFSFYQTSHKWSCKIPFVFFLSFFL